MNPRYTLAVALLFSTLPQLSFAVSDSSSCRSDVSYVCECRAGFERLAGNDTDIEVALAYLLSKEIPQKYNCSFDLKGRIQRASLKYFLNRFLLHNSLDVVVDLPSAGTVEALTTDQALEVSFAVVDDLWAQKSSAAILTHAGKVYLREKVVSALVWLLKQTNAEALLPDSLTDSGFYYEARNEVARYFVDKGFDRVLN